jgi:hypothetical protein
MKQENFIKTIKKIVEEKQFYKFKKQTIDLYTASLVLKVYNSLGENNKQRLNKLGSEKPIQAINICYKLVA